MRRLAVLALPAIAVGIGSALMLWALDELSHLLQTFLWTALPGVFGATEATPWWIITVLTLVGLAVGLVVQFMPGHGGADSATTELDAPPPKLAVLPSLAVVVVLGLAGGVSLGPENPIIAINSGLAVALLARVSGAVPPKLVGVLASSATIGALFGTPVAAALVLTGAVGAMRGGGSLWDKLFLPLSAAGAGAITMHLLGGAALAFSLPPMGSIEAIDLVSSFVIAAVAALVGILAAWALTPVHRVFHGMKHPVVFTTLGGLLLGVLGAVGGPITMFKGLEQTGELLRHPDAFSAAELATFAGIKLVALVIAAAAGFRGGRIFPIVFVGVALGLLAAAIAPGVPIALAVASAAFGITLAATRDGWIAMFLGVALVGDVTVLPLLCVVVLPVWLIITKAPELVVHEAPATSKEAVR